MLDKQFRGMVHLIVNVLCPGHVVELPKKVRGIGVTEWAMPAAEDVCKTSPHVDLDHFEGFGEQVAEHDIEGIRAGDVVERVPGEKNMPLVLKCQAVAAEPIVVHMREKPLGGSRIGNRQATLNQPGNLVGVR